MSLADHRSLANDASTAFVGLQNIDTGAVIVVCATPLQIIDAEHLLCRFARDVSNARALLFQKIKYDQVALTADVVQGFV